MGPHRVSTFIIPCGGWTEKRLGCISNASCRADRNLVSTQAFIERAGLILRAIWDSVYSLLFRSSA
jgi:hypothetical protein